MNLLEILTKEYGEEKGKEIYKTLTKNENIEFIVQDKEKPTHVPASKLEEKDATIKNLEKTIEKNDKDLKTLKKEFGDNEETKKKIEMLEEENKIAKETYETEIRNMKYNYALNSALQAHGARNPKAVGAIIDSDKIKYIDGEILGLDEQIKALKESDGYLFASLDDSNKNSTEGGAKNGTGKSLGNPLNKVNKDLKQEEEEEENPFISNLLKKRKERDGKEEEFNKFFID